MEVRKNKLTKVLLVISCWLLVLLLPVTSILALTANVRIEAPNNETIFSGNVTVPESSTIDGKIISGYKEINAIDAASKVGNFSYQVTDWGEPWGFSLDSVNGISAPSYAWWNQRINWKSASLGISNQPLNNNDYVLLHLTGTASDPWSLERPLKLQVSKTNLDQAEQVTINTSYFDDNDQSPAFEPVSATIKVGASEFQTDSNGQLTIGLPAGIFDIYAFKQGFVKSNQIQLKVGKVLSNQQSSSAIKKAVTYLRKKQSKDGKIQNPAVSAWAAIAFAAAKIDPQTVHRKKGVPKNKRRSLVDYLKKYSQTYLNRKWLKKHSKAAKPLATDYARQILAFYAAKKNPRNYGGVNLVKELSRYYKKGQFGSTSLVNDDIFTIIAYRAARVNPRLKQYRDAIRFVKKNQKADGGFSFSANPASQSDIDTTAAAIQALVLAKRSGTKNLVSNIHKAYDFLVAHQNSDGGFSYNSQFNQTNSQSTAWATQAIVSAKGVKAPNTLAAANGMTPLYLLSTMQNSNGGFGNGLNSNSNAWATAQVIPALAKKPWPIRWK